MKRGKQDGRPLDARAGISKRRQVVTGEREITEDRCDRRTEQVDVRGRGDACDDVVVANGFQQVGEGVIEQHREQQRRAGGQRRNPSARNRSTPASSRDPQPTPQATPAECASCARCADLLTDAR